MRGRKTVGGLGRVVVARHFGRWQGLLGCAAGAGTACGAGVGCGRVCANGFGREHAEVTRRHAPRAMGPGFTRAWNIKISTMPRLPTAVRTVRYTPAARARACRARSCPQHVGSHLSARVRVRVSHPLWVEDGFVERGGAHGQVEEGGKIEVIIHKLIIIYLSN